MFLHFYLPFRVAGKEAKGRPKRRKDCRWHGKYVLSSPVSPPNILLAQNIPIFSAGRSLPRLLGNSTPSNACLCDHSDQSAASQTCFAPLAAIGLSSFSATRENPARKTASLLMRACFRRAVPCYHGLSFFFLPAYFFFLSRKKEEKCWRIIVWNLIKIPVLIKYKNLKQSHLQIKIWNYQP